MPAHDLISNLELKYLKWLLSRPNRYVHAVKGLVHQARQGSEEAVYILGKSLCSSDARLQQMAFQALQANLPHICLQPLWQLWAGNHHIMLEELLVHAASPARANGNKEVYLYSLLLLGQSIPASYLDEKYIPFFLQMAAGSHPALATHARQALKQLKRETAINALIHSWCQDHRGWLAELIQQAGYLATTPLANQIASALLQNKPEIVLKMGAECIQPLFDDLFDPVLGDAAEFCLRNLNQPSAISEFCILWKKDRNPNLQMIMNDSAYLPAEPPSVRILCALFNRRVELAAAIPPSEVPCLLEYLEDVDLDVRQRAEQAVLGLKQKESQQAVCAAYIENDRESIRRILLLSRYLPDDLSDRALCLFLLGQWLEYETLDFDHTILRIRYQTASFSLRKRILNLIQTSGRTEWLSILTAFTEFQKFGSGELEMLIHALSQNQAWHALFDLALKTPVRTSLHIFEILAATRWRPEESLRTLYGQLLDLAHLPHHLTDAALAEALPLAALNATLHVHNRVNDVSFSPNDQYIALATSARRVLIWDYRQGKVNCVIKGFNHSVGRVAYLPDGSLAAAERTSKAEPCGLYHLVDGTPVLIGTHAASIADIIPIHQNRVVTIGNDQRVILWDLAHRTAVNRMIYRENRGRAGAVQRNGEKYAVATNPPGLFSASSGESLLPSVIQMSTSRGVRISAAQHAAFTPQNHLLIGQYNGQIIQTTISETPVRRTLFAAHPSRITGLQYLPNTDWIISTDSSTDQLVFTNLSNPNIQKKLTTPAAGITALFVSPSGHFIACGFEDQITLWDARLYSIPAILNTPLSDLSPATVSLLNDFLRYPLPVELIRMVLCVKTILEHRFAYDIEMDNLPHIQPGEFDILIEDEIEP